MFSIIRTDDDDDFVAVCKTRQNGGREETRKRKEAFLLLLPNQLNKETHNSEQIGAKEVLAHRLGDRSLAICEM